MLEWRTTHLLPYLVSRASLLKYALCSCWSAKAASLSAVKVLKHEGTSSMGEPPPGRTHISLAPYTAWHSHALISVSSLGMFVNISEWIRCKSRSGSRTIRSPASMPGDTSLHPGATSDTVRQLKRIFLFFIFFYKTSSKILQLMLSQQYDLLRLLTLPVGMKMWKRYQQYWAVSRINLRHQFFVITMSNEIGGMRTNNNVANCLFTRASVH